MSTSLESIAPLHVASSRQPSFNSKEALSLTAPVPLISRSTPKSSLLHSSISALIFSVSSRHVVTNSRWIEEIEDGCDVVRANGEEGLERSVARASNVDGITGGWKSHLLQVLHSLISRFFGFVSLEFTPNRIRIFRFRVLLYNLT